MTRNPLRQLLAAVVLSVAALPEALADNIQDFGPQTFAQIKAQFAGKPFIVSLWSVDCAPCRVELDMLGKLRQADPDFPLVVISTDTIEKREEADDILLGYALDGVPTWMFADSFVERLRFSIDPMWYGELPRSYFYAPDHSFTAHSGILTAAKLAELFPYQADSVDQREHDR
jgi:thiol-disulfide isomerase/thioredoxin